MIYGSRESLLAVFATITEIERFFPRVFFLFTAASQCNTAGPAVPARVLRNGEAK